MEHTKILVIGENPDEIRTIMGLFEAKFPNAALRAATTIDQAIRMMSEETPDIVLMDVTVPETDGIPLALQMRNDKRLKDVPIVYLTEHGDEKSLKISKIRNEDYILKPLDPDNLIKCIKIVAVENKLLKKPIYPITYLTLDLAALILPIAAATYYLIKEIQIPTYLLTPYALLTVPTIAEHAKALMVWAFTYMIILLCIDLFLRKCMPDIHEMKHTLPETNLDYWQKNKMKFLTQTLFPIWLVTFLPAYFLRPTITLAIICLMPPSMLGLFVAGYWPKKGR
ncbi:MAG: response regulator [Candidatus Altiarchaeota archaeon]